MGGDGSVEGSRQGTGRVRMGGEGVRVGVKQGSGNGLSRGIEGQVRGEEYREKVGQGRARGIGRGESKVEAGQKRGRRDIEEGSREKQGKVREGGGGKERGDDRRGRGIGWLEQLQGRKGKEVSIFCQLQSKVLTLYNTTRISKISVYWITENKNYSYITKSIIINIQLMLYKDNLFTNIVNISIYILLISTTEFNLGH